MNPRGFLGALLLAFACGAQATTLYEVRPSSIDPGVKAFDTPNVVMFDPQQPGPTPLVLFLPGTHGKPGRKSEMPLMNLIVKQGYRLIWMSYDNDISESKICPRSPDPGCAEAYRRMRTYGEGEVASLSTPPAESIVTRFTRMLQALDHDHPGEGWASYLVDGKPDWKRIVVSGHSQGAGMAALIAKDHEVNRVVLFSSPWDDTHALGHGSQPAPWLSMNSATPATRWFAEYNKREDTAKLIARAYAALDIPQDHILVFDLDLPEDFKGDLKDNPYHPITIRDARYAPLWQVMFGTAREL
ncbi:hypothetical protein [Dyella sp. C9]|uniref:BPSS1187 family protein n=1 Tax=Dyella sp. C9 TaxID=2202154 RepID=UPI000DEF0C61|nr:hypothetical protein [Dyella sp. C9]